MDHRLGTPLANLSPQAIRQGLNTRWLGKQDIHCLEVVESTNSVAKDLARHGAPEGTIVLAEAQSLGRGRLGRHWVSPYGKGLYLSVILRPEIPPAWGSRITLTAGVALAEAIHESGIRPELKWPNDIMVGHRKVAGIFTEASLEKEGIASVIVGAGINVNTSEEDFPESIRDIVSSLRLKAGKSVSRVTLLQQLLGELEGWYELLCQGSFDKILLAWRKYETILGRMVEVSLPHSQLFGMAEDLDPDGKLLVRDKGGQIHRIMVGDVIYCRLQGTGT